MSDEPLAREREPEAERSRMRAEYLRSAICACSVIRAKWPSVIPSGLREHPRDLPIALSD
jgi:hypothetical protein